MSEPRSVAHVLITHADGREVLHLATCRKATRPPERRAADGVSAPTGGPTDVYGVKRDSDVPIADFDAVLALLARGGVQLDKCVVVHRETRDKAYVEGLKTVNGHVRGRSTVHVMDVVEDALNDLRYGDPARHGEAMGLLMGAATLLRDRFVHDRKHRPEDVG